MEDTAHRRTVSTRALLVGILLVAAINLYDPFSAYVIHASPFTRSHFPFAVLFVLLVMALVVNPLLRRWAPGAAFSRAELMTIVAVGFLGRSIRWGSAWLSPIR